ncbi:MAG: thioredoxin family protein [Sphingomonadales bacterium]|nr:thioredoxin family protein [Sphingomonadales bacterium]
MRLLPALAVSLAATAAVADKPAGNVPAPTSGAAPIVAAPATPPVLTNYFRSDANAAAMVDGAVAEAKAGGRRAILVFGADWCSDSVALAAVLSSDFFQAYLGSKYSVTFIDVNRPTRGQGRNQEIVRQFGIETMTGTPEVVVIGRSGRPLNTLADAQSWRNAGERPVLQIMGYFRDLPED